MLLITETPHQGPQRSWSASSREEFCLRVIAANYDSGELDPNWTYEQIRDWLRSDLRALEISEGVIVHGHAVDYEAAVNLMDDEIREQLSSTLPEGATPQQFVDAYAQAHEAKFDEEFRVE